MLLHVLLSSLGLLLNGKQPLTSQFTSAVPATRFTNNNNDIHTDGTSKDLLEEPHRVEGSSDSVESASPKVASSKDEDEKEAKGEDQSNKIF